MKNRIVKISIMSALILGFGHFANFASSNLCDLCVIYHSFEELAYASEPTGNCKAGGKVCAATYLCTVNGAMSCYEVTCLTGLPPIGTCVLDAN
jgi:hypothetical protein